MQRKQEVATSHFLIPKSEVNHEQRQAYVPSPKLISSPPRQPASLVRGFVEVGSPKDLLTNNCFISTNAAAAIPKASTFEYGINSLKCGERIAKMVHVVWPNCTFGPSNFESAKNVRILE
ncbi:hypothetical protein Tco_1161790, partial [Tanacetum coccineum]